MNYLGRSRVRLIPRNEGKLKSHDSCNDCRAWSHDQGTKARYLSEWMKADMPVCLLPVGTLANVLTMTLKKRMRVPPRCHPDCKSKIILDSICDSCHAIKECLRNDEEFDQYFEEEEFETSHWPCERCIDALKTIKMFWKIILNKLFKIDMSGDDSENDAHDSKTASVQTLAKVWRNEIVQQALYVKNFHSRQTKFKNKTSSSWENIRCTKDTSPTSSRRKCKTEEDVQSRSTFRPTIPSPTNSSKPEGKIITAPIIHKNKSGKIIKTKNKSTNVKIKTFDVGCETSSYDENNKEIKMYKANVEQLQSEVKHQKKEIERLNRENNSLRGELQNVYKCCTWKSSYDPVDVDKYTVSLVPKLKTSSLQGISITSLKSARHIDSEMIITLKKIQNENYRQVSMLQVLHKTNDPSNHPLNVGPSVAKEDPISLLSKVQETFTSLVEREINIANDRNKASRKSSIDASFQTLINDRLYPSYTTLSSTSNTYISARDASTN